MIEGVAGLPPIKPMPSAPLVISAQIQRSGGSLVHQLFDHHPNCATFPGELYLHPTSQTVWAQFDIDNFDAAKVFAQLRQAREPQLQIYLREGYSRYASSAQGQKNERLPFLFVPEVHRAVFLELMAQVVEVHHRQIIDAYLRSFFTAWLDYQRRYGDLRYYMAFAKRINWPEEAELFFADYPDGWMITNVRRPDHWLASARRLDPNNYGNPARGLSQWSRSASASIKAYRRWPDRVLIVGFDRLVTSTEEVMAKIAERIGIPFVPEMTRPTFNGMPIESGSSFLPRAGIDRGTLDRAGPREIVAAQGAPMALYEEAMSLAI